MHQIKKLAVAAMTAVMVVAQCIPVLAAAPTGTITVDNSIPGERFDFYRIFQYDEATGGYSVVDAYLDVLKTFTGKETDADILVALSAIDSGDLEVAGAGNDAKELAYVLYGVAKDQAASDGNVTVADDASDASITLDHGYYLVVPTLPEGSDVASGGAADAAVVSLGILNDDDVTIHNKMAVPASLAQTVTDADESDVPANSAGLGNEMTFTVKGIVPAMNAYDHYVHDFHVVAPAGLKIDPDTVKLVMGGVTVIDNGVVAIGAEDNKLNADTKQKDATGTLMNVAISKAYNEETDKSSTVDITIENLKALAPTALADSVLTYKATLTKEATLGTTGNTSTCYVQYSNDPNDVGRDGSLGRSKAASTTTYTYGLDLGSITRKGAMLGETGPGMPWTS